jgi:hypothetical protein
LTNEADVHMCSYVNASPRSCKELGSLSRPLSHKLGGLSLLAYKVSLPPCQLLEHALGGLVLSSSSVTRSVSSLHLRGPSSELHHVVRAILIEQRFEIDFTLIPLR